MRLYQLINLVAQANVVFRVPFIVPLTTRNLHRQKLPIPKRPLWVGTEIAYLSGEPFSDPFG